MMMTFRSNVSAASVLVFGLGACGCSTERADAKRRITPEYDQTGKLQLLKYDSTGSGRVDTWGYMNGARVVRIEIDRDANGTVDRVEYYQHDVVVRVDQDTDGDGRTDKWETYADARLASVAFDTSHRGVPDRRLTYGPDGAVSMEVDVEGDGRLLPAAPAADESAFPVTRHMSEGKGTP